MNTFLSMSLIFEARDAKSIGIIDGYAAKGYHYAGFIPTVMSDYGKYEEIDLIFEM